LSDELHRADDADLPLGETEDFIVDVDGLTYDDGTKVRRGSDE
jgi:hypothetical protein